MQKSVYFSLTKMPTHPTSPHGTKKNGTMNTIAERLLELDVRHNELLDKLTRLDQQIDDVLKEWSASKDSPAERNDH